MNSDSSNCNLSPSVTKSYMKSNESVKIDITKKKVEDGLLILQKVELIMLSHFQNKIEDLIYILAWA